MYLTDGVVDNNVSDIKQNSNIAVPSQKVSRYPIKVNTTGTLGVKVRIHYILLQCSNRSLERYIIVDVFRKVYI